MKRFFKSCTAALSLFLLAAAAFAQETPLTRQDGWYAYDDREGNGGSSVSQIAPAEETIGGAAAFTITMTGTVTAKYQYGFAGFGFHVSDETLQKLAAAKGIKFKYAGDGNQYRFRVETSDVKDYDVYGKVLETKAGKVSEASITFKQLKQEGWGAKAKFDSKNIAQLAWQSVGQPLESVMLKVWDIEPLY